MAEISHWEKAALKAHNRWDCDCAHKMGLCGMYRNIICLFAVILSGCAPADRNEAPPPNLESKNYAPCAVLQDYLVERRITFGKPETIVSDYDRKQFNYVDPTPVWTNKMGPAEESTANTARESLTKAKDYIDSRLDLIIEAETYAAYMDVQEDEFDISKCVMPPYIYTKADGLDIIKARSEHNIDLRFKAMQAGRAYSKGLSKTKEKYDQKKSEAIRQEIYKDKQPYRLRKFSRIGINPQAGQAFFYTEEFCGELCADGSYVIMALENGRWKVKGNVIQWMS